MPMIIHRRLASICDATLCVVKETMGSGFIDDLILGFCARRQALPAGHGAHGANCLLHGTTCTSRDCAGCIIAP
jgi:hypothetical protein